LRGLRKEETLKKMKRQNRNKGLGQGQLPEKGEDAGGKKEQRPFKTPC